MKKGRHRRFEEARALKRGPDVDIESLLDDLGPMSASDERDVSDEWDSERSSDRDRWYDDDEYQRD